MPQQQSKNRLSAVQVRQLAYRWSKAFWGQWKNQNLDTIRTHADREYKRLRMYSRFLGLLGKTGKQRKRALYYPGAGTDLVTPFLTGLSHHYLVDPKYFKRDGYPQSLLRALISAIDPSARFKRLLPGPNMRANVILDKHRYVIHLIQASNLRAERYVDPKRKLLYLAKGNLRLDVIVPPEWLRKRVPLAFGIDSALPTVRRQLRSMFKNRVFFENHALRSLEIFRSLRDHRLAHSTQT